MGITSLRTVGSVIRTTTIRSGGRGRLACASAAEHEGRLLGLLRRRDGSVSAGGAATERVRRRPGSGAEGVWVCPPLRDLQAAARADRTAGRRETVSRAARQLP